jgi:hypothetical protein
LRYTFTDEDGGTHEFVAVSVVVHSTRGHKSLRWYEGTLIKTVDGTWACQILGKSQVEGETTRVVLHTAATDRELTAKLGQTPVAQKLYQLARVDNVEWLE